MKKFLCLFLGLILLCSSAFAAVSDYSSMTVDELQKVIDDVRNEILKKTVQGDGKLFLVDDPDGISMYLTGNNETDWMGLKLEVVVINNADKLLSVSFDNVAVNGWEVNPLFSNISDIGAGKKKKDGISFNPEDAEISSIDEVTEIELSFHTFDEGYSNAAKYGPVTIYYDGTNWSTK